MSEFRVEHIRTRIGEIISASTNYSSAELCRREMDHLHKDLGIDSLTLLEIALSVDQEFETDFSEEELLGMESIQRAAEMVANRLEGLKGEAAAG